jgi:serine/threonine-protein kinase
VNGTIEATVPFLAPEQVRDTADVDERADVWALGAILHTLLTGRPPFYGTTVPSVLAAIAADAPTPLADLQRDVAPGLESAVLQCLAKERDERFYSVADLLSALRPFASGDAVAVLERVTRGPTRPPPLPGVPLSVRAMPLTPPRRNAIVPVPRPPVAPVAPKSSYIAGAAGVGAGVGAAVALVMAVLLRVGAPAAAAPPAAPVAVAPIAPLPVVAPPGPALQPSPAQPAAVPAAAPVVATPPAPPAPAVQKPQQVLAKATPKATTKVAEKPEPVAGRSEGDLFDDPR